jgi:hypothetical protein
MIFILQENGPDSRILCVPETRFTKMKLSEAYDECGDLMSGDEEVLGLTTFDGTVHCTMIVSPEEHCTEEVLFEPVELEDDLREMVRVSETDDTITYRTSQSIIVEYLNSDFEQYIFYDADNKEILPE